jgi:DNA gyrase inhibitor GyrI
MSTNNRKKKDSESEAIGRTSLNVQIVRLGPMRVASVYAYGTYPEKEAWDKLVAWSLSRGFLDNLNEHPIFGYNPKPLSDSSRYGYELWIKVDFEEEPEDEIKILDFLGGPYAVTRFMLKGYPHQDVILAWQKLYNWCEQHGHKPGYHQPLEKFVTLEKKVEDCILDLYCPINY